MARRRRRPVVDGCGECGHGHGRGHGRGHGPGMTRDERELVSDAHLLKSDNCSFSASDIARDVLSLPVSGYGCSTAK